MTQIKQKSTRRDPLVVCRYMGGARGKYVLESDPVEVMKQGLPQVLAPYIREVDQEIINLRRRGNEELRNLAREEAGYQFKGILLEESRNPLARHAELHRSLDDIPNWSPPTDSPILDAHALRQFLNVHILQDEECLKLVNKYGFLGDHFESPRTEFESVRTWRCESFLAWTVFQILNCKTLSEWSEKVCPGIKRLYKKFCYRVPALTKDDLEKITPYFKGQHELFFNDLQIQLATRTLYLHAPDWEPAWKIILNLDQMDKATEFAVTLVNWKISMNCSTGILFNDESILKGLHARPEGQTRNTIQTALFPTNLCGAIWYRITQKLHREPALDKFCQNCGAAFIPNPRQAIFCKRCRKGSGTEANNASARLYRLRKDEAKKKAESERKLKERISKIAEERKRQQEEMRLKRLDQLNVLPLDE